MSKYFQESNEESSESTLVENNSENNMNNRKACEISNNSIIELDISDTHSKQVPDHCDNLYNINSRIEDITISSHNETTGQNVLRKKLVNSITSQTAMEKFQNDLVNQRCFSSPVESSNNEEIISEMKKPDVWEALLILEQTLSPFAQNEKCEESFLNNSLKNSNVLNRLSQRFRESPRKFTEKLVTIIENSIISSESPVKHNSHDSSGISLHRMTGEFRKLCKFIEDESMPEWAPSLMENTYSSCIEKPENCKNDIGIKNYATPKSTNYTPLNKIRSQASENYVTPKSKAASNITPIKQFTPSQDKSFEFLEYVCNVICEDKPKSSKKTRRSLSMPDVARGSMDEMLSICERQLASLDDTVTELRSSEPCKKINSDLKLKITQTPRSKSMSKIFLDCNIKPTESLIQSSVDQALIEERNVELNKSDLYSPTFESFKHRNVNLSKNSFNNDFELLPDSPVIVTANNDNYCDDYNDQDCSLLIELAKRRQRCLDTAKLMMEIDNEDPIINQNNKCMETLYKLGIQDETFTDTEDNVEFLKTLNNCMEYNNYFSKKSKPIINMLEKFNSPVDLKTKATEIKSRLLANQKQLSKNNVQKNKTYNLKKLELEKKNSLKSVRDRQMTPKVVLKTSTKLQRKPVELPSTTQQKYVTCRKNTKQQIEKKNDQILQKKVVSTSTLTKSQSMKKCTQPTKIVPRASPKISSKHTQVDSGKISLKRTLKSIESKALSPQILSDNCTKKSPEPFEKQKNVISKSTLHSNKTKISPRATLKSLAPRKLSPQMLINECTNETPILIEKQENIISKTTLHSDKKKMSPDPTGKLDKSPAIEEKKENVTPNSIFKPKFFITPGKSPNYAIATRKKPVTYFSNVRSPIGLYINNTDNDLITNAGFRVNEYLLTPLSNENSETPELKYCLFKKNKDSDDSDIPYNRSNTVKLPKRSYERIQNIQMTEGKKILPSSLTSNSRIQQLLKPIEDNIVIRHEGRFVDCTPKSDNQFFETSVRVRNVAEKVVSSSISKK